MPTIKFTVERSKESVSFLDTNVNLDGGRVVTDLLMKTHQYLATNSCDPRHCKEAIPTAKLSGICSSDETFNKEPQS